MSGARYSSFDCLLVERRGRVGWLINNRPERLNAMSARMRDELAVAWAELDRDPAVRVIVHTGEGRGPAPTATPGLPMTRAAVAEAPVGEAGRITDEGIARLRARIGVPEPHPLPPHYVRPGIDAFRHVAVAYGDNNPLWCDPEYATASRWGAPLAPPPLVGGDTLIGEDEVTEVAPDKRELMKGDPLRGVHAYYSASAREWWAPLRPDRRAFRRNALVAVLDKPSEFAERAVHEWTGQVFRDEDGTLLATQRRLMVRTERRRARVRQRDEAIEPARWSDDDIAAIEAQYAREGPRGTEPRWWEDVAVGVEVGPMVKGPLTVTDMICWHVGMGMGLYGVKPLRLAYQNRQRIASGGPVAGGDAATAGGVAVEGGATPRAAAAARRAAGGDAPRRPRVGSIQRRLPSQAHRLVPLLLTIQTPVVGAVRGWAAGIGLHLVLAADFAVVADDARLWEPFAERGFTPDSGGTWLLPRRIGEVRAWEMLLLGRAVDGREAAAWGMVHQAVPAGDVGETAAQLARRLASGPTVSLGLTKWLLHQGSARGLDEQLRDEAFAMELSSRSEDFREGLTAFRDKRPPDFTGR